MNKPHPFKYHSSHNGFCRVMYSTKNSHNQTIYYCLQDNGKHSGDPGIQFYRCSKDGEADYIVELPKIVQLPQSPEDSQIDIDVNKFLIKLDKD